MGLNYYNIIDDSSENRTTSGNASMRVWRRSRLQYLSDFRAAKCVGKNKSPDHKGADGANGNKRSRAGVKSESNVEQYLIEIRENRSKEYNQKQQASSYFSLGDPFNTKKHGDDERSDGLTDLTTVVTASTFCDESTSISTNYTVMDANEMNDWVVPNHNEERTTETPLVHESREIAATTIPDEGIRENASPKSFRYFNNSEDDDYNEEILAMMESIPEEDSCVISEFIPDETASEYIPDEDSSVHTPPLLLNEDQSYMEFSQPSRKKSKAQQQENPSIEMCGRALLDFCPYPMVDGFESNNRLFGFSHGVYFGDAAGNQRENPPSCAENNSQAFSQATGQEYENFGSHTRPEWLASMKDSQNTKKKRPEWLASWRDFVYVTGRPEWMASWKDLYISYNIGFSNERVDPMSEFEDQSCYSDDRSMSSRRGSFDEKDKRPWKPQSAIGAQIYFSVPWSRFYTQNRF